MLLFVYGTLRQQASTPMHGLLARYSQFIGNGKLQGRLYLVGDYPGAILSSDPADWIVGEIYRLDHPSVLGLMDEYEECTDEHPHPHEYIRQSCRVLLASNQIVEAWVYLFNHSIQNLKPILSGDFLNP